ncbi:hypothetical protein O181_072076, partial [Austropuccinia psidii MF-1]|nr:hypothetical protein [Austropuccinia psidii MF-1]
MTHSPQGNPIGVAPEVPILRTRKDGELGKLKRNLVVQDENDTDAEGSDELEITTLIQKEESNPLHYPKSQSPIRPSTLASTSTNIQPPVESTCRYPMSPEPESIFDNHCGNSFCCGINNRQYLEGEII